MIALCQQQVAVLRGYDGSYSVNLWFKLRCNSHRVSEPIQRGESTVPFTSSRGNRISGEPKLQFAKKAMLHNSGVLNSDRSSFHRGAL